MANRYSSALLVFISKVLTVWIDKRNTRSYLIVRSLSGRVSLVMGRAKKPKIYFFALLFSDYSREQTVSLYVVMYLK